MKKLFKKQLDENNIITEENLKNIVIKTYKNGDEIKVGDKVLYAFLTNMNEKITEDSDIPMERSNESQDIKIELIILNENQFDLYSYDEKLQDKSYSYPIIKLK